MPAVRRRYRLEVVNENTLARSWSVRLTGWRAVLAAVAAVAAIGSLIAVVFMFTPLGRLLPGHLRGSERSDYLAMALQLDSLQRAADINGAYAANLHAILTDSTAPAPVAGAAATQLTAADSLLEAGAAEADFVRRFDEDRRFNLSVLSPIAAEGMNFEAPSTAPGAAGPVAAVYRGTVIRETENPLTGMTDIVVQHPNDFLSVYTGLAEAYVAAGQKVSAGQRIGLSTNGQQWLFELWHAGSKLDAAKYINYESN